MTPLLSTPTNSAWVIHLQLIPLEYQVDRLETLLRQEKKEKEQLIAELKSVKALDLLRKQSDEREADQSQESKARIRELE